MDIPPQQHRHHYVKATFSVHEYRDGWLAIFDGPSCVVRLHANGKPIKAPQAA